MKGLVHFSDIEKLKGKLEIQEQFSGITFTILEKAEIGILIEVKQDIENIETANQQFPDKRLREIVHETFSEHTPHKIYASTFKGEKSAPEIVTTQWIENQKYKYRLKSKTVSKELGVSESNIKAYMDGTKPLTSPIRAMFYFYFMSKKLA